MAVYRDQHEDVLRTCPYNSDHRVATRRYQVHVEACGKKVGPGWTVCQFNQSHRLQISELKKHLITCPDNIQRLREIQERNAIAQSATVTNFKSLPVIPMADPSISEDPWADEGMAANQQPFRIRGLGADFDRKDFINNPDPEQPEDPICLQRLDPAERKTYRENRRKAIAEFQARKRAEREQQEKVAQLNGNSAASVAGSSTTTSSGPASAPAVRHQPYPKPQAAPTGATGGPVIGGIGRGKTVGSNGAAGSQQPGRPIH